jgi:PAS domain S-box-containing protein
VGRRPNPQINIGSVDLSCAFVVTNAKLHDNPIEYVSESFERLTGYTKHEIRGRNCRFLQSPDGKVEAGVKRKYCDDDSVLYLKNCIARQEEAQISLINYRKGGQPFMNLLTMIPIYDDSGEVSHFVGLQVDLVENPTAINSKNPGTWFANLLTLCTHLRVLDGSYSINYQRHAGMPSYLLHTPESYLGTDYSQTVPRDDVSTVLSTMDAGETEFSRRLLDKVLLENTDDVIHVLSLKGLFQYLSPACQKVLEYSQSELVGTALSAVCHPSDIVPVTRELKETSSGNSVSVVFRIKRKHSGYMWFESHGSLHTEQGKGRKCIILVGRERPVYTILKNVLLAAGGIGDNELWTKMSTTGMFLYVSSNVRQLLDRQPEELVGTNVQSLMRQDSKEEFGRVLTLALTGKNTSVRHELTNKRGQVLQAFSWLYPGDALEGQKPTFLVAQIRLIRYHRGGGQRPGMGARAEQHSSGGSIPSHASTQVLSTGNNTPMSASTGTQDTSKYISAEGFPTTTASGQHSLAIGRQDASLASDDNIFEELKTTRSTSWQFELRQMEKRNRILAEEVQSLIAAKKKRKRRRGAGMLQKDCANCHTKQTPEWRRGPSGQRDLCNSCGLRWAKQVSTESQKLPLNTYPPAIATAHITASYIGNNMD